jgi:hypothetical protein
MVLVGFGLWTFMTELLPNLLKIRSLSDLKAWIREFWGGLLFTTICGSILALIAFLLFKIGL